MSGDNKRRRKRALIRGHGETCSYCGARGEVTIDHRIPKSIGGPDALWNLQLLCLPCNQAKGDTGAGKSTVLRWRGLAVAA